MSNTIRRTVFGAASVAAGALMLAAAPGIASAAPASTAGDVHAATPCGYAGYEGSNGQQPLYNHCGSGNVEVEVDHFFWQTTYFCAHPGVQTIPQGDSRWRIIDASYDGKSC